MGLELVVLVAAAYACFQMGREWERGFAVDDCPFGAECIRCNPPMWQTGVVHMTVNAAYPHISNTLVLT